jgi:pimeloyl-ACP methyl ester carboxylesterase
VWTRVFTGAKRSEDEQAWWRHQTEEADMPVAVEKRGAAAIRPFRVDIPDEALEDLRRRIAATRLPSKELVSDRSQGVQLETIQELVHYWATEYDWRRCEARLNAVPQFKTEIDGVDTHFIHVKSGHEDALPLIMTHGWPGSVIELLETVAPLTDPTAHGGRAEDAFHLVLPSVPGYAFSAEPTNLGWYAGRVAEAWGKLMPRLGYTRYVAQGGDVGAAVTDAMGRQAPEGLIGIHTNLFVPGLAGGVFPNDTEEERAAAEAGATFRATGFGYFLEQTTRPQTIGYALLDSPVALAAWMLDHDTDSYYKISRAFVDRQPVGGLTRDHILDNITTYWLTGTGASAARSYWENGQATGRAAGQAPPPVSVPVGFTTFPGEIVATPRSWVEQAYPTLIYFNKVDKGGHFAAWEEPELFATEIRAAFHALR